MLKQVGLDVLDDLVGEDPIAVRECLTRTREAGEDFKGTLPRP
jgi:hypothetical protein